MRIILGSNSPRRKKMLEAFCLPFIQAPSDFDESLITFDASPEKYVMELAQKKAESLALKYPHDIILTADTIVYTPHKIFTKPENEQDALRMLRTFSGSKQDVYTGVCATKNNQFFCDFSKTRIYFQTLNEQQLQSYHKAFYLKDAAGGYDVTESGSIIIEKIEGCYFNIKGFPLLTIQNMLSKVGVNLWDYFKS